MHFFTNFKFLLINKANGKLTILSELTNVPYRTIQDINKNKTNNPTLETGYKFCKAFNITIKELVETELK